GHTFVVPAGWSVRTQGRAALLTPPEAGSLIALVDTTAATAADAVLEAWAAAGIAQRRPLTLTSERAARDGWAEIRGFRYETTANDTRVVFAQALRHGARWTAVVADLDAAVADKRNASIEQMFGRLWPQGYTRESFAGRTANTLDPTRIAELTRFVDSTRERFGVPGIALGLVQDGKVVFAGGFGVRELGKPDPIDANTLFFVASNTKPLTSLMLAKLVDAGKFGWDTPVTSVLPSFRIGDDAATRQMRMKHLVCACTGMPRQDMEWVFGGDEATPATLMRTLATMQPTSGFGEVYQYSNPLVAAAGYVGGKALYPRREFGAAYDKAMQKLVFDPLGMKATTFDFARALRRNHASPHAWNIDGTPARVDMGYNYSGIPARPEGGAWSNVTDLLRYVQMELDGGRLPDGTRYIGEAPLLARREQQVTRGDDLGYGIGVKIDRSTGATLLHHGGIMAGYVSDMMWLPEHRVGAVILINAEEGTSVRGLFRRRLLEVLFDGRAEAQAKVEVQRRTLADRAAADRKRLDVPADAAATRALASRYREASLGDIEIRVANGRTHFDFGGWDSEVATRRDDDGTLSFVTISPGVTGYPFVVGESGGKRTLVLRDAQHEYRFVEVD
ncbi:MAG TPA: serine hydrolase domain-containing protein, partial [Tahibacter sp.]|uniref:serine hydrolase domain-containing protein n=1 Tax=Tahibacter sp. TaxID=2056211 RepID=UPI002C03E544